jgi:uncharacterized protein (TIGR03435 family)
MTPSINVALLAVGSSLAASIVVKVTVIISLALCAAWLARGSRAAVRHALLAAAFGVTLLLPIASVLVPPVHLGVPVVDENRASAAPPLENGVEQIPPALMADPGDPAISAPQSSSLSKTMSLSKAISLSNLLLTGWIAGGAIFLLPLAIGLWQVRLLRRSGLPWRHGQSLAETIARDAGVHRRVEVLLHEGVPGPVTCGIVHPTIVLPRDAESWSEDDLSRAFMHELEHVRRGDSLSRCLARGACAVYWFHPLVWIAWRRLGLEAERSCDDAVLRRSEATAYAGQLVGLAKRLSAAQRSPLLAMANRADLATRVRAVLDARQRRGRAGVFSLGLAATAALVLVISMSSLILVATPMPLPLPPANSPKPPVLIAAAPPNDGRPSIQLAQAQTPAPQPRPAAPQNTTNQPEFDVASVKVVDWSTLTGRGGGGRATGGPGTSDPGRFSDPAATMMGLLMRAFGSESGQILGAAVQPRVGANLYEVTATMPPDTTKKQFQAMLQNLLAERFHLVVHHETRNFPAYELVVDNGGPKMKEATHAPDDSPEPTDPFGIVLHPDAGDLKMKEQTTEDLAKQLEMELVTAQRIETQVMNSPTPRVVDKTGLTGKYTFTLEFSRPGPPGFTPEPGSPGADLPDLFVALRQQLGLRLNKTQGVPVDVIVVDSVDTVPVEN